METIKRTLAAIALLCAPAALAQTYIVPEGDCGAVTLRVTGGEDIAADRVTDAFLYLPKQRLAMKPVEGSRSLNFNASVPDNGVVMAAVDFKPVVSGNETRTEHAKAFLFCGATPIADWQRSTGLGLEIYPQSWNGPRPKMKPGDTMRFIAVDEATGKFLRDLPMELYREGAGRIAEGVPAQHGGMNFPYPEPGRYMVMTTYRRPDPQQPEHWLVDTSTLTFEVK
jgi:hypothetical protein